MGDIGKTSKQAYKELRLLVRLDREERRMLEELASRWGVPMAGAIRRLIREESENETSLKER